MPNNEDVRDLVSELTKPPYQFDPSTHRKGVVQSIQTSGVPSVTVTLSGDDLNVPGVKYGRSYFPTVGDTVLMVKQGKELVIVDSVTETYKADYTRTAADAGNGLNWNANQFSVKTPTTSGITVDANGVSVKANSTSGLATDTNGVRVSAGSGIIVDSGGTRVRAGAGIAADGTGVRVVPGNAINVSGGTVNVTKAARATHTGIAYGGVTDPGNLVDTGNAASNNNFYALCLRINDIHSVLIAAGLMNP